MRLISSKTTFYYKRIFPAIWFGVPLFVIAISLATHSFSNTSALPLLIGPSIMIVFGYFIMKKLVFDLLDQVWEDGDALVLKNRGQEERLALSDIKNVSYSPFVNPPRVVLSLRRSTVFGDTIAFGAPVRFVPFSRSPVIDDLIDGVDAARKG